MKLSVLLSGLRPNNWMKLYQSIIQSFHGEFEFIIVSPYEEPFILDALKGMDNTHHIHDMGSPLRCYQIALTHAKGEHITWAADDGWFLPNALDISVKHLDDNPNSVVVGKYNEGEDNYQMDDIRYYYPARHDATRAKFVPQDCLMLMEGVIPRETMINCGGWDASKFECFPMGAIDLSVRLHNKGLKFIFQQEMLFKCGHTPGMTGDHAPVHNAQTKKDVPMFNLIYNTSAGQNRIDIDINNWEKAPSKWRERFGE